MRAVELEIHPAFFRRVRHYKRRIAVDDSRPKVAERLLRSTQQLVLSLIDNPRRGHSAGFESLDLRDILRASVPGFPVFAVFYRWDGRTLTIITLEHTAQDLPPKIAAALLNPPGRH